MTALGGSHSRLGCAYLCTHAFGVQFAGVKLDEGGDEFCALLLLRIVHVSENLIHTRLLELASHEQLVQYPIDLVKVIDDVEFADVLEELIEERNQSMDEL